jgi:uncharacterized membrane protein YedE/YeeE
MSSATVDVMPSGGRADSAEDATSVRAWPVDRGRPYADPYLAGVGVGLALLAAFVVAGRGLGASGAFSSAVAAGVSTVAPAHAAANPSVAGYLTGSTGGGPLADWLVFEIVGVALGGFASAALAGRWRASVERGPRISKRGRLAYAFAGGVVMGVGAKLARGCTSGQALTGGALLSVGSWLFIATAFAAAYLAAPLFRRQWT